MKKLFSLIFFVFLFYLIFSVFPKPVSAIRCDVYWPDVFCWIDDPSGCEVTGESYCQDYGGQPRPSDYCAQNPWTFEYVSGCKVCQIGGDPGFGGYNTFQYVWSTNTCSTQDRCYGATTGASGYDAQGRVLPGICDAGSYDGSNPDSACVSGGYYKQCCSAGGYEPTTYCSNGACPAGQITAAGDTTCDIPKPSSAPSNLQVTNQTCNSNNTVQVSFSWNGVSGADGYHIYFWNGITWDLKWDTPATNATLTPFPSGAGQTWMVRAYNSAGEGPDSSWSSFTAKTCVTIQGYKVVMPGNQDIEPARSQTVSLDGNAATRTSNPYFFEGLEGSDHSVSVPTISGYNVGYSRCYNRTDCHSVSDIVNGSLVNVSVPAGGYADLWWHYTPQSTPTPTICTATAPSAPFSPLPSSGATNISLTPTLSWTWGDWGKLCPPPDDKRYYVWFGTNSNPQAAELKVSNQVAGTASYSPGTLTANTTYYWRVAQQNSTATYGPVWSFKTTTGVGDCPGNECTSCGAGGYRCAGGVAGSTSVDICQSVDKNGDGTSTLCWNGTDTCAAGNVCKSTTCSTGTACVAGSTPTPTPTPTSGGSTCNSRCVSEGGTSGTCSVACAASTWYAGGTGKGFGCEPNVCCCSNPPASTPTPTDEPPPPPVTTYQLDGYVFIDSDHDGRRDTGEATYTTGGGTTLTLSPGGSTDKGGFYQFWGLDVYTAYTVTVTVPAGWVATTGTSITLCSGCYGGAIGDAHFNFGIIQPYIKGTVFLDTNGNGSRDPGEETCSRGRFFCERNGYVQDPSTRIWYKDTNGNGKYDGPEATYNSGARVDISGGPLFSGEPTCRWGDFLCNLLGYIKDPATGIWYKDTNGNGRYDPRDPGYRTTDSSGNYVFDQLSSDFTYSVELKVPVGYAVTTTNPVSKTLPPAATVNFGINRGIECSDGIDNNGNSRVDCADPGCHTDGNASNAASCDPADTDEDSECGDAVDNDGDSLIDTADPGCHTDGDSSNPASYNRNDPSELTSPPLILSSGSVLPAGVVIDSAGNNCQSGTTPLANAIITSRKTVPPFEIMGSDNTDASGAYSISDTGGSGDRTAVMSNIAGFQVTRVKFDNGAWTTSGLSGYSYGPFSFSSNHTLDWCVSNITPWFQTTTGDVRMNSLTNRVPSGKYASSDSFNPSVFYSSNFTANFGSGGSSTKRWAVSDEYTFQDDSRNRNGSTSYSFYASRIAQQNVTTSEISGCGPGDCSTGINNLSTGAYRHDGNLTIASYSHRAGARVLLLINGNVTIQNNISVPQGALLIIAAKGNIKINKTIGITTLSSTTPQLQGIFTAEGDIEVEAQESCAPARRVNVAGALIANSLKPFQVGGGGALINNRSLCVDDQNYPSLYVTPRYDFVTQLTDFYKTSYTRWREVAP